MIQELAKYFKGDRAIWLITIILGVFSLLLVYSSIVTLAYKYQEGNTIRYLLKHSFFLLSGFGIIYITHRINYKYFSKLSVFMVYLSIPLLLLTLVVGTNINEASRWLTIPVINQSFQTSDFAKLALVMYVARMITLKQENIHDFQKSFLPIVVPAIVICMLILPANFSTAAVLFSSSMILMFIGRIRLSHLFSLALLGIVAIFLVLGAAKYAPTVFPRAQTWVNRVENFKTPDKKGSYQVEQAKIAVATGQLYGKGPGNSVQRNFLPHPYSDFIYAIVIEEYGIIGGLLVLVLYLILFLRCIRIMAQTEKLFASLLVCGLGFILVFQALINMAVAVNLMPVTGQPLPMISMGGTSIWFTSVAIGIILSVSRSVEKEKEENNGIDNPINSEHAIA